MQGVYLARLLSVNVGLPREITWRGETVYTSVWKEPVQGRRLVRRLNIDGDAQGDLVPRPAKNDKLPLQPTYHGFRRTRRLSHDF
jgi:hypothetical protein